MAHSFPRIRPLLALLAMGCLSPLLVHAQEPGAGPKKGKDPSMIKVTDVAGLPRVLLIGDSISMGYTPVVREMLKGRANVHRPLENCGPTSNGLAKIDAWLGTEHWDVIHFNFGLHDLKYADDKGTIVAVNVGKQLASPEVYQENLRKIVARLKKTGAKLIFATITPVPAGTVGRNAGDDQRYNAKALEVMKETGVEIDDLGGFVRTAQATPATAGIQKPKNVHFTDDGSKKLAELVVASIVKALPAAAK